MIDLLTVSLFFCPLCEFTYLSNQEICIYLKFRAISKFRLEGKEILANPICIHLSKVNDEHQNNMRNLF